MTYLREIPGGFHEERGEFHLFNKIKKALTLGSVVSFSCYIGYTVDF